MFKKNYKYVDFDGSDTSATFFFLQYSYVIWIG